MSLFSRLGAVFRPETRAGGSYTDQALEDALNRAQGNAQAVAEQTAAVEFAVGLLARCFAAADVSPPGLARTLPPALRARMARRLLLKGDFVAAIEVNRLGNISLLPASSFDVQGGVDESAWSYYLELPAPTRPESRRLPARAVVHVRIGEDQAMPWRGCSPLANAGISAGLLAMLEHRTAQEAGAQVGYVLPMPEGIADDSVNALKADLAALKGKISLVESTASGHGQGPNASPQADWRLQRLGAEFPEGNATMRRNVGADVCAALGIPAALFLGADGATVREAYRQLLVSTIQPFSQLVTDELELKLESPIRLDFRRLAAADIAARARAYGSLIQADVAAGLTPDPEQAARLAGLRD